MSARLPSAWGAASGRRVCRWLLAAGWSVRVTGAEHVPATGPVILAPNHVGFIDGPLLFGAAPRPVHSLTKDEMFRGPVGWVLRGVGQVPVKRDAPDRTVLQTVLAVLDAGRVVAIYPEGTRGTGEFAELRPGLAWFALRSGSPVVPVVFIGSGARGRTLGALPGLRARIDVVFGPAVRLGQQGRQSRSVLDAASEQLRESLVEHHAATHRRFGEMPRD